MESNDDVSLVHGIVLAGSYPSHRTLDLLGPRPLLPAAQQPLVSYALRSMAVAALGSATICANNHGRGIRARLKNSAYGLRLDYFEDWSPRGTAGCVRDAGLRTKAQTFVVADGTSVPVVDVHDLLARHQASGAAITAVAAAHPSGRMRPSGVYVFDRRALAHVAPEGFQDIKEKLVPALYAAGEQVAVHVAEGGAPRVVNADSYLALNHWLVEQASRRRDPPEGFRCAGETMLHHSARVDPTARLLGPLLLGAGVEVGEGATLVGPMSIGPHTTIGKGAVVSRSVLCNGCVVGTHAFVDRSMLSDHVIVPSRGSVVSALQTGAPRAARPRPRVGQMLWQPVQGILRLAAPHDA